MNSFHVMQWAEQENLSLTEEQKAYLQQLESELNRLQKDVEERQLAQLVEEEMQRNGVSNQRLLWALLDRDCLSVVDGQLQGLSQQLKALKEDRETAFLFEEKKNPPRFVPVGHTKRQKENAARTVMGLSK